MLSFFTVYIQNRKSYMENHVLISLGSNLDQGKEILQQTCGQIRQMHGKIVFSSVYRTPAYGNPSAPSYHNCIGYLRTPLSSPELQAFFKTLENQAGRIRTAGSPVALDIDILQWNERILKPSDFHRNYVQQGVEEIKPILPDILYPPGC